jgi:hypothetical protein
METNDKMKELNQQRKEHGQSEMDLLRSNFWKKKQIEDRKRFERQTATEGLLDLQYLSDNSMIFELFVNWSKNAKTESQNETINASIRAVLRMQSYVSTLQTTSKLAVSNMIEEQKMTSRMATEIRDLKQQVKSLKAEIEHYEQD